MICLLCSLSILLAIIIALGVVYGKQMQTRGSENAPAMAIEAAQAPVNEDRDTDTADVVLDEPVVMDEPVEVLEPPVVDVPEPPPVEVIEPPMMDTPVEILDPAMGGPPNVPEVEQPGQPQPGQPGFVPAPQPGQPGFVMEEDEDENFPVFPEFVDPVLDGPDDYDYDYEYERPVRRPPQQGGGGFQQGGGGFQGQIRGDEDYDYGYGYDYGADTAPGPPPQGNPALGPDFNGQEGQDQEQAAVGQDQEQAGQDQGRVPEFAGQQPGGQQRPVPAFGANDYDYSYDGEDYDYEYSAPVRPGFGQGPPGQVPGVGQVPGFGAAAGGQQGQGQGQAAPPAVVAGDVVVVPTPAGPITEVVGAAIV